MAHNSAANISKFKDSAMCEHLSDALAAIMNSTPKQDVKLKDLALYSKMHLADRIKVEKPAEAPAYGAPKLPWRDVPKKKKKRTEEDGEPEPEEPEEEQEDKGKVPDLWEEAQALRWCGVVLHDTEVFRLTVAIKNLLEARPLESVKLWGKVFGIQRDYVIVHGVWDMERLAEEMAEKAEAEGRAGEEEAERDKNVYFVTYADDFVEWHELPDLDHACVHVAQMLQRYFTGNLDAPVHSHPPFPGVERHLLRAQIARITHTTTIMPKHAIESEEEEPEDEDEENKKPPPVYDMLKLESWVHALPELIVKLKKKKVPVEGEGEGEEGEGEAEEEPEEEEGEEGEGPPQNVPLTNDLKLELPHHSQRTRPIWAARRGYQANQYFVRSLLWPGAVTCTTLDGQQKVIESLSHTIYVGNAVKHAPSACTIYMPLPPPEVQPEFGVALTVQMDATVDDEAEFHVPQPIPEEEKEQEEEEEA